MHLRISILLLISSVYFSFSCNKDEEFFENISYLEKHRQLAFDEMKKEYPKINSLMDSIYYKVKYDAPDTITIFDPRIEYIKKNPMMPKFILRALFKKETPSLISIGEYLMNHPEIRDKIYSGELIFSVPIHYPDELHLGFKSELNIKTGLFMGREFWIFKYGFLWDAGII